MFQDMSVTETPESLWKSRPAQRQTHTFDHRPAGTFITITQRLFRVSLLVMRSKKRWKRGRHWWLTPVILATQEVKIRRISV
jgi:hypothetical protein